jgi:hypothetical protein
MKKKVRDLTLDDYKTYCNLRTYDGNWSMEMALICIDFLSKLPKRKIFENKKKYKAKCEKIFQDNLHLIWNLEDYPNMSIDINTGQIEVKR